MTRAQFEEKTYETAYTIELALGLGGNIAVFSPGQVLEKLLGFDAAANPDATHVLWSVLSLPRPPGVRLVPSLWGGAPISQPAFTALPSYPVSVFFQFKRPEFLNGPRAKQWHLWHGPYYRFARSVDQQRVLARLERRLGPQAVVRYAAPAFHTLGEFETAQVSGTVISRSGHVRPEVLRRHKVWTYDQPGAAGRGNPSGGRHLFENFQSLLESAIASPVRSGEVEVFRGQEALSRLRSHLSDVADACRQREPTLRDSVDQWSRQLRSLRLERDVARSLRDYASIQSLMSRHQTTWWLSDRRSS
jgi:hypothetical protein